MEFAIAMAGVIVRQAEGSLRAARAAWKDAQRPSTVRHYSRALKAGQTAANGVYSLQRAVNGIGGQRPLALRYSGKAQGRHCTGPAEQGDSGIGKPHII